MSSSNKTFPALFALALILLLLGLTLQEHFFISDQFERARIIESIKKSGFVGIEQNVFGMDQMNPYPPLFDLLVAAISLLTGLSILSVFKSIGFFAFMLIAFYSFKVARLYLSKDYAYIVSALTVLMPWLFRRELSPIPETFGLMFFTAGIYFLLTKKYGKLALIFPAFTLFHFRSFLTFGAVYIAYSAYLFWKKEAGIRQIALPVLTSLLSLVWILPRGSEMAALHEVQNPWINFIPMHEMFSFLFFASLFFAVYLAYKRKARFFVLWFILGTLFYVLFPFQIFAFRESAFLFLIIPMVIAIGMSELEPIISKNVSLGVLSLSVFYLVILGHSMIMTDSYFTNENIAAIKTLENIEGEIVLSDFVGSYAVPYSSGKKVVIGPFMESVPDADERLSETHAAFSSCSFEPAMKRFNADILHISPLARNLFGCTSQKIESSALELVSSENGNDFYIFKN